MKNHYFEAFNQSKTFLSALIFSTLALSFLILNDLLIFNEELLILLSFGIFISISFHLMKESVKEFFQNTIHTMKETLQQSVYTRKKHLQKNKENIHLKKVTKSLIMHTSPIIHQLLEEKKSVLEEKCSTKKHFQTHDLLQHVQKIQSIPSEKYQRLSAEITHAKGKNIHTLLTTQKVHEYNNQTIKQLKQAIIHKKEIKTQKKQYKKA